MLVYIGILDNDKKILGYGDGFYSITDYETKIFEITKEENLALQDGASFDIVDNKLIIS